MQCDLSTTVGVEHLVVFAEMAVLQKRPELGRLCRGARLSGRLDEEAIRRALPGVSESGARNLLRWGQSLALWDSRGTLTALGENAATDDICPVPEQGVYEWWIATHPLFGGTRLLHVERRRAVRDGRLDEPDPLPKIPSVNVPFRSVVEPDRVFLLRDLPRNSGSAPHGKLLPPSGDAMIRCRLDFTAGTNEWQIEGEIHVEASGRERAGTRRMQMKAESARLDPAAVFVEWVRRYLPPETRWDAVRRELCVPFPDGNEQAQEKFLLSFPLEGVEIPGHGTFEKADLRNVPLAPITPDHAQRWADARLHRRLTTKPVYRSRTDVRDLFASRVRGTPLARHRPVLPSHDALVKAYAAQPDVMWSLLAPVDLAPSAPGPAQLHESPFSEEVTP
ncbi:MAG: hypothetical protein R3B70_38090 [Polyangiaceae bacterium]